MHISQIPPCGSAHNYICRCHLLLLWALWLTVAGCGQNYTDKPSSKESTLQSQLSPAVRKLSPDAARMELAKLNREFTPNAYVASAKNGDKLAIELYLAAGMNVNAKGDESFTALMAACAGGNTGIAAILLGNGSDVNAKSRFGDTALMVAASGGHTEIIRLLLDRGADFRTTDANGLAALSYAASRGQTEAMAQLVEKGSPVNARCAKGTSALMWAAKSGSVNAVKFLISQHADLEAKDIDGLVAMDWAGGDKAVRAVLQSSGAKPVTDSTFKNWLAGELHLARPEVVKIVIHACDKMDESELASIETYYSDSAVANMRQHGLTDSQIAQVLLLTFSRIRESKSYAEGSFGGESRDKPPRLLDAKQSFVSAVDRHSEGAWAAFERALVCSLQSRWAQPDLRLVLSCSQWIATFGEGADCKAVNVTALMVAVGCGRTNLVSALLERGADPDARDSAGKTAMDYAVRFNQHETAQLLIEARQKRLQRTDQMNPPSTAKWATSSGRSAADKSPTPEEARAALAAVNVEFTAVAFHFCITQSDTKAVALFLLGGMDPNTSLPDAKGMTPLMLAAGKGQTDIVKLLLNSGAKLETKEDRFGATALMFCKTKDVAELLVSHGARTDSKDKQGTTALMHAAVQGRADVAQFLNERGADVNEADSEGITALMHAAANDHVEILRLLLDKGAKVDAQDKNGRTAAMYAAVSPPKPRALEILVKSGANGQLRDKTGKSLQDYVNESLNAFSPQK